MTSTANTNPSTSTLDDQYEIKTIIHDAVADGVKDLLAILEHMKRSGEYTSQELKESEEFVALGEERERLAVLKEEILELTKKLIEETKAYDKADEIAERARLRRGYQTNVVFQE